MKVFLAGVMQASRLDSHVDSQQYRIILHDALKRRMPDVEVVDPWALNPGSVHFEKDRAVHTFVTMAALAAEVDAVIAYLPYASMGTAVEVWTAHQANVYVVAVTPMTHNWFLHTTAHDIVTDLEGMVAEIENGRFEVRVRAHQLASG